MSWQVYDLAGRVVWSETQVLGGGRHELRWDTARGTRPGLYLARVRVAGICGTDLRHWNKAEPELECHIVGHELPETHLAAIIP